MLALTLTLTLTIVPTWHSACNSLRPTHHFCTQLTLDLPNDIWGGKESNEAPPAPQAVSSLITDTVSSLMGDTVSSLMGDTVSSLMGSTPLQLGRKGGHSTVAGVLWLECCGWSAVAGAHC